MNEVSFSLRHIDLAGLTTSTQLASVRSPTLALHGWLDNAASFLPLMPYLNQRPVVALDLPGHGWSGHRAAAAPYYFIEWAADIIELIEQQNWSQVHLLGHSMGGFISQLVASVIPERIQAVSLIESFGLLTFKADETRMKLQQALAERRALVNKVAPVYADKERIIRLRAEKSAVTAAQIAAVVERNLYAVEGGWSWRVDPKVRLSSTFRYSKEQADDIIAGIVCPVQCIRGEQGYAELQQAFSLWGSFVALEPVISLAGGHHVHLEQPQKVAAHINAFLQGHPC